MTLLSRFVDYILLSAIALVLLAKLLSGWVGWLGPWVGTINVLMELLLASYGILNGLRLWKNAWGAISLLAGATIVAVYFTNLLPDPWVVVGVCNIAILVIAILGPRARRSRRH